MLMMFPYLLILIGHAASGTTEPSTVAGSRGPLQNRLNIGERDRFGTFAGAQAVDLCRGECCRRGPGWFLCAFQVDAGDLAPDAGDDAETGDGGAVGEVDAVAEGNRFIAPGRGVLDGFGLGKGRIVVRH